MNLTERPLTQKVNQGDEPISNTIFESTVTSERSTVSHQAGGYETKVNTREINSIYKWRSSLFDAGFNRAIGDEGIPISVILKVRKAPLTFVRLPLGYPSIPQGQPSMFRKLPLPMSGAE